MVPPPDHGPVHHEAMHGAHPGPAHHGGPGHAMPHRFEDAEKWAARFEAKERDAWQKPDAVVAALALAKDAHVADIGSGTGYFAVRLARAVPEGKVYAVDVEPDMVRYLGERTTKEGLANVENVLGAFDDPKLPAPVDLVFLCDTYHHISDRVPYFQKVREKLRPGGRLAIVDFELGDIPVGPPEQHRISPDALTTELAAAGYERVSLDEETLPYQYVAVFRAR